MSCVSEEAGSPRRQRRDDFIGQIELVLGSINHVANIRHGHAQPLIMMRCAVTSVWRVEVVASTSMITA